MNSTQISSALRRTLLLKVISRHQPSRDDIDSVIRLMATKVVEGLEAQSMSIYLVEQNEICFKYVYYSPTLWLDRPERENEFAERRAQLLKTRLKPGTGIVGQTIAGGHSCLYNIDTDSAAMHSLQSQTGFPVRSMITVPLRGVSTNIGAIQVLNKEPAALEDAFSKGEMEMLEEVAEYSSPLIQRMLDPNFKIDDRDTAKFIARFTENPLILSLDGLEVERALIDSVGDALIQRTGILPFKRLGPGSCAALIVNPLDFDSKENFERAAEMRIDEVHVAPKCLIHEILQTETGGSSHGGEVTPENHEMAELADVIGFEYGNETESDEDLQDEESAPIIQMANRIIEDAYICGASDVHIEPQEDELVVRYRVDGACSEKLRLPKKVAGALVARIKVMSELDIAEKRLPQDGRIPFRKFTKKNIDIDLRVAIGPMQHGEKVVLRILDKSKSAMPITSLGFSEENLGIYREVIREPHGMILHCGPTGSGKSMTLFSALREVSSPEVNILTAEDPVEYTLNGVNQMQMNRQIDLTFARALRCYLRMDPDIILVGEIRDRETAEIGVEAALTGHLLLSTLHTNDAPSTVARLTDMGIEPFMVSASLLAVCAQRLMRRTCRHCRSQYTPEGNEAELLARALDGWHGDIFRAAPSGCPNCGHKGYKGRIGIHELMVMNDDLVAAINRGANTDDLRRLSIASGMKTLHQDSLLKVKEGISTLLEAVATVTPDDKKYGTQPASTMVPVA